MASPPKPRSRHPSNWPKEIIDHLLLATREEVCTPFETEDQAKAFKRVITDIRRSFREHQHPDAEAINSLRTIIAYTSSVIQARPRYTANPQEFPLTIILSPTLGFQHNLSLSSNSSEPDLLPVPEITLTNTSLEDELARIIHEDFGQSDNDAAEFIRSRRRFAQNRTD